LKHYRLHHALVCLSSAVLIITTASSLASQTVVIGPRDSIDSLARKYHVSKKEIAKANGISTESVLVDGKSLIIPDPPSQVSTAPTMRVSAAIRGDRITVRRGPDAKYIRLTLLDDRTPLIVTARKGDWSQVTLANGSSGWVRSEFLSGGKPTLKGSTAGAGRVVSTLGSVLEKQKAEAKARAKAIARCKSIEKARVAENRRQRRVRLARENRHRGYRTASHRHHSRPEADAPQTDSEVIRTAYAYRGVPYRYGGTGGRGFDCSGFTSTIYRKKGVALPRTAAEQFNKGEHVDSSHMKQGDLVFFHTTRRGISHVGIYAGKGKFVHASSGGGRVRVDSLESGYYKNRFRGARRVSK
jgi:cell wall-associated NlpC family hydrolase